MFPLVYIVRKFEKEKEDKNMKFELTYHCGDGIYSSNIVYAADERAAKEWYDRVLRKPVLGVREMVSPFCKPGQPIVEVPMTADEIIAKYD